MMNKPIFGRFIPGDSFIHKLDPRGEITCQFLFYWNHFLANNWQSYLLAAVLRYLAFFLSKIDLGFFVRGVRPLIWLILFTVALQILSLRRVEKFIGPGGSSILPNLVLQNGAFIFLPFCFDYFYVDIADVDDTTFGVVRCNRIYITPIKSHPISRA